MENQQLSNKLVITGAIVGLLFFVLLRLMLTVSDLIILLNSLFTGCMFALAVAFAPVVWGAVIGERKYGDVRQFTLSFALTWIACALAVLTSIYVRSSDSPTTSLIALAFARYVLIIAAVLQITAPDFGLGILYGRDRKVLTASLGTGLSVALFLIFFQRETMLAP